MRSARVFFYVERASLTLLGLVGLAFLVALVFVCSQRLAYPFELEWMEGGSVAHVQRVLNGEPIFAEPTLDFVAFIYTPLYYYVSALVAMAIGNGFFPLRLVSFASSLGSLVFIFLIVRRRTRSLLAPFVAACLYAATFDVSGGWFDIARVDAFFLFVLLAGIYMADAKQPVVRSVLAPVVLFLSFTAKQAALVVVSGLSLLALVRRRGWERYAFGILCGALISGWLLTMNVRTDGWFGFYVLSTPSYNAIIPEGIPGFLKREVANVVIACAFSSLAFMRARSGSDADTRVTDALVFGSLILSSFIARIRMGAFNNVSMPFYAGVAIYFGIGLHEALWRFERWPVVRAAAPFVALLQFGMLWYSPRSEIPTLRALAEGQKLIEYLDDFKGEVYVPSHPWYLHAAHKPSQAHGAAVADALRAQRSAPKPLHLEQDMRVAIEQGRYDAVISDREGFALKDPEFDRYYREVTSTLTGDAFTQVSGADRRPSYVWVRRTPNANGAR